MPEDSLHISAIFDSSGNNILSTTFDIKAAVPVNIVLSGDKVETLSGELINFTVVCYNPDNLELRTPAMKWYEGLNVEYDNNQQGFVVTEKKLLITQQNQQFFIKWDGRSTIENEGRLLLPGYYRIVIESFKDQSIIIGKPLLWARGSIFTGSEPLDSCAVVDSVRNTSTSNFNAISICSSQLDHNDFGHIQILNNWKNSSIFLICGHSMPGMTDYTILLPTTNTRGETVFLPNTNTLAVYVMPAAGNSYNLYIGERLERGVTREPNRSIVSLSTDLSDCLISMFAGCNSAGNKDFTSKKITYNLGLLQSSVKRGSNIAVGFYFTFSRDLYIKFIPKIFTYLNEGYILEKAIGQAALDIDPGLEQLFAFIICYKSSTPDSERIIIPARYGNKYEGDIQYIQFDLRTFKYSQDCNWTTKKLLRKSKRLIDKDYTSIDIS